MTDSRLRTGDPQARVPFVEEASEASNELARIRHEMGEVEGEERTVRAEYERVRKISVRARATPLHRPRGRSLTMPLRARTVSLTRTN